jgi:Ca2+-binding RTX toxin-like protein
VGREMPACAKTYVSPRRRRHLRGVGNDTLDGGDGNDLIVGGTNEDVLRGMNGDDTIYTGTQTSGDKNPDEVYCGEGHDAVYLSGQDHASFNTTSGACEEIKHY